MDLKEYIKSEAARIGFPLCGVAQAVPLENEAERLAEWIRSGKSGEFPYITDNIEAYSNCLIQYPEASSVIVCGLPYGLDKDDYPIEPESYGEISQYAIRQDYHRVVKEMLDELCVSIHEQLPKAMLHSYSDTGHFMEKAFAVRSGIGWQGKNTLIVNPEYGSFLFLGIIITDIKLDPDKPIEDGCKGCRKCIEACPTAALSEDRMLSARHCISYWTTGRRELADVPESVIQNIGNRLYACDECQLACPWNSIANTEREPRMPYMPGLRRVSLEEIDTMSQEEFNEKYGDTAIGWLKAKVLKRNARLLRGG